MQTLPLHMIDSHFHLLSIERKGIEVDSLLNTMQEHSMEGIDIGLEADDLTARAKRFAAYPFVRLSGGIGPWGVKEGEMPVESQLETLQKQLDETHAVAIGEIGLDNHWDYGTKTVQEGLLLSQIDLAEQRNLPVIFHNREADEQFLTLLRSRGFSREGVFHCFQGSEELAKLAIHKGFFLSFAGPLTYKANKGMQELFVKIPAERILLETDSPYLSPNPMRGRPNTPLNMEHIYRFAAELRGMELADLIRQVQSNFHSFLRG
ncbi:TatD family hydrolase [Sphaerochaeta halotolerans]|uniref:TatD family hydrolase n=1 Tax=Sphaerochaeta halotolerans TaxID=2293840 RepID=UPI00136EC88E|nr:TatD family hydrolase [Sphaerochaeta halotolerans]MXI85650.1 YchF/TatD family DNA exonuclease [Sphaerochaeta halotolerans]